MQQAIEAAQVRRPRRVLPRQGHRAPLMTTSPYLRPRRSPITAACSACRTHKVKCTGERPMCQRCLHRSIECVYTTRSGETPSQALSRNYHHLQEHVTAHEELFDLLKHLPKEDAQDVLQRIRSGDSVATILNHVKTGDILLQMAVSPGTHLRYNFPYIAKMPEDLISGNHYLDSPLYAPTSLYTPGTGRIESSLRDERQHNLYFMPFHAARVIEPLLSDAQISWWTSVCQDDTLMQDLIRMFLHCEYHFTAAFQKDLFLEDMMAHRQDFCSPLLVNIVLAYSCVCYPHLPDRAKYWESSTLTHRFLAEAKRLWELEASEARITTIQAGILFSVVHNLCGLDEVGKPYRIHAVALAHVLNLFDGEDLEKVDRIKRGKAFTAWTLYNWETITAFSFMNTPLLDRAPSWSLPDPSTDLGWYGEIWVQYPTDQYILPTHFGDVFYSRCQFRVIMNEYCHAAHSPGHALDLSRAYEIHQKLRSWYDTLPKILQPNKIVFPGQLQLHIYYYHVILSLYKPLRYASSCSEYSPKQIIAQANMYLETLIRLYYLRHGFEAMDLFIVIPLALTACDCIDLIDKQSAGSDLKRLLSTLILVVQGLYTQRKNHYLANALFWVIRGRMRPQDVVLLTNTTSLAEEKPNIEQEMTQAVRSHWPISVVENKNDLESHILTNLLKDYARLNTGTTSSEM